MSPPSVPTLAAALLALLVASPPPARAASGWRGDGTGRYPEAQPPLHWSTTDNVAWSTPMPSWGYASPVSAGDRICVTSEPSQLLCVSARDGRLLWKRD
ncbi:MAG: PQQ-binding-like beta-propeller repeat protein, partial [Deltaproteobacteria bacterium]|nr:PQQ-binding-like beta-propeller repeat protein [Deltaproteobacteria bacterium]